jgi:RNA polymerase sigma factor for flagellar operon FliA
MRPQITAEHPRVVASLQFVEQLARRVAATMPHSIDIGDLVQDGVIGLIDAAHRFDESRGIKFETFAERRIRGAMIDALRKDAWPRGVRRQRRELEAAREALRRETGSEPSLADLAARVGTDEARLGRTIVRISTIESTSMLSSPDGPLEVMLPDVCLPPETPSPDRAYESSETRLRVRRALQTLPPRERKVIGLYYYGDVTMKQIGAEIGVNESRVSQLHARAIKRLRVVLADMAPAEAMSALKSAVIAFHQKPVMAKASLPQRPAVAAPVAPAAAAGAKSAVAFVEEGAQRRAVVVNIKPSRKRFVAARLSPGRPAVAIAR